MIFNKVDDYAVQSEDGKYSVCRITLLGETYWELWIRNKGANIAGQVHLGVFESQGKGETYARLHAAGQWVPSDPNKMITGESDGV